MFSVFSVGAQCKRTPGVLYFSKLVLKKLPSQISVAFGACILMLAQDFFNRSALLSAETKSCDEITLKIWCFLLNERKAL